VHPVLHEPVLHTEKVIQSSDKPRDEKWDGQGASLLQNMGDGVVRMRNICLMIPHSRNDLQ
jgi:hypothetical protein